MDVVMGRPIVLGIATEARDNTSCFSVRRLQSALSTLVGLHPKARVDWMFLEFMWLCAQFNTVEIKTMNRRMQDSGAMDFLRNASSATNIIGIGFDLAACVDEALRVIPTACVYMRLAVEQTNGMYGECTVVKPLHDEAVCLWHTRDLGSCVEHDDAPFALSKDDEALRKRVLDDAHDAVYNKRRRRLLCC